MPFVFVIPGALRELAGNRPEVRTGECAGSVRGALAHLWTACPALRDRIMTEQGTLRLHINIFVNGEHIRYTGGLDGPVADGAEILLLPAISGGAAPEDRPAPARAAPGRGDDASP